MPEAYETYTVELKYEMVAGEVSEVIQFATKLQREILKTGAATMKNLVVYEKRETQET